ncbi:right-handed parallel beta-helix repeat-containing protein [Engelhardtia mirabilis]|uniref:Right handed beta helix domain-containing protein n=1 Tax=Engelhardtia mirabilis TaxID=2528011 RepID=A0A518BMX9_9BACT|nr:hypothetical protein Pla133_34350 [Planctomycetes bacterium Pla133]QDV02665.1 hypothetical protein Pla86_34340 [Planctomycetes bacterium Pla86]
MKHQLVTLSALALLSSVAAAMDTVVAPGQSIQAAIDLSQNGDRVLVQPGTYFETISFDGKGIEVIGTGGAEVTILDGAAAGPIVRFLPGQDASALLQGFTVTHGHAALGAGGINSASASPRIEDCTIRSNSGKFGGGVSGNPTMRRCEIAGNSSSLSYGGGIYGAPHLYECVIVDNSASGADGGGIYLTGGVCNVTDCVVAANRVVLGDPARGGGIAVHSSAVATIERSVIADNAGFGNIFGSYAGGIWATPSTTIDSCTIVGNRSVSGGNTAGGGVWGATTIRNTILRGNEPDQLANNPTVAWSNVEGGYAGLGNFDADALFVAPTASADLHLASASPCIDAGNPSQVDPDGTRIDVGAFPFATLYPRGNTAAADWVAPSWTELSTTTGGLHALRISLEAAHAGEPYFLLGSFSGTTPGLVLDGQTLPLVVDAYTSLTLVAPAAAGLAGSIGILDGDGRAEATLTLPAGAVTSLAGATIHHAALTIDLAILAVGATTNAVALQLLP